MYLENKLDSIRKKIITNSIINVEFEKGIAHNIQNDFDIFVENFNRKLPSSKPSYILLNLFLKNNFNNHIEYSEISIELILKYNAGKIKFKNNEKYIKTFVKLTYPEVENYFKKRDISLYDIQKYTYYIYKMRNYEDDNNVFEFIRVGIKKFFNYSEDEFKYYGSELDKFEYLFDNNKFQIKDNKFLKSPSSFYDIIDKDYVYALNIFDSFEIVKENGFFMDDIPTIDKFKANEAFLNIYLEVSNSNGFYYSDKIKTIDITDKWNEHFVKN